MNGQGRSLSYRLLHRMPYVRGRTLFQRVSYGLLQASVTDRAYMVVQISFSRITSIYRKLLLDGGSYLCVTEAASVRPELFPF